VEAWKRGSGGSALLKFNNFFSAKRPTASGLYYAAIVEGVERPFGNARVHTGSAHCRALTWWNDQ